MSTFLNTNVTFKEDVQKGDSTRPQERKSPQAYPLGYVEDFDETRTQLEAGFSISL
jgi:hypothetical protein